jgi:hypothetical protein
MTCTPFTIVREPQSGSSPDQGPAGTTKTYKICCTKTYAQTLFLGCSIKSFNASLAWGAEASRLTVELIYDNCKYPVLNDINDNPVVADMSDNDYINKLNNNTFTKDKNGLNIVPGKVYYTFNGDRVVSRYWLNEDPGFYGDMPNPYDSIDIVGSAVYFKYDYFEFSGVVKSWEKSGGQSSNQSYTVTIEVPTFLLTQTQMILSDYTGSIHTKWPGSIYGTPRYQVGTYIGDIYEQNLPNVINVFGFLEDITDYNTGLGGTIVDSNNVPLYRYGGSGRTEEGIPASKVVEGIIGLLDSTAPFTRDKVLRYSPFGRIVGASPRKKITYDEPDWSIDKYRMGLVEPHNYPSNSGQRRTFYTVDVNAFLPATDEYRMLLNSYRISENKMSIMDFAQNLTDNFGYKMFVSMSFVFEAGIMYPRLVFNTITTQVQPPDGSIANFMSTMYNLGFPITQYTSGEEYNDNNPKRTMIIGGKQHRLFQVKNTKYSFRQSILRYNPYTNTFIPNPQAGLIAVQRYRIANAESTRSPALYTSWSPALAIGRVHVPVLADFNTKDNWQSINEGTTLAKRGNYFPVSQVSAVGSFTVGEYPSASSDAICPYFGNNLITGIVRNVVHHVRDNHHGIGFMVYFTTDELHLATGTAETLNWVDVTGNLGIGNQYVRISEAEIRCCMSGIDCYVGLLTHLLKDGRGMYGNNFKLDIYDKFIYPILGSIDLNSMSNGLVQNYDKYSNSQTPTQNIPNAPASDFVRNGRLHDLLSKLQEFFKKIGDEYYGKQFMVSVPTPQYWTDTSSGLLGYNASIQVGFNNDGTPIYLTTGSNKMYYQYEPTDTAWEEPYNIIDDTLIVGEPNLDPLTDENGSIKPIVGYDNNAQFDYDRHTTHTHYVASRNQATNNDYIEFTKFDKLANANLPNQAAAQATTININSYWVPSLTLSDSKDGQTVVNYPTAASRAGSTAGPLPISDAYNVNLIPQNLISKVYKVASVEKKYETHFIASVLGSYIVPKIIIKTDGLFINPIHEDKLFVGAVAADFLADDYNAYGNAFLINRAQKVMAGQSSFVQPNQTVSDSQNITAQNSENKQFNNLKAHSKAAIPSFIGIPMIYNDAVYGPWISSPDLVINRIFPYDSIDKQKKKLENIGGGVNLEINSELVPWNYGGMRILDEAAILLASANNDYQTKSESGQLSIYGLPNLGLGSQLYAAGASYGPIINNVQVQVGENGPLTTYTLRTFTRKFTLFNKENSDRLKSISQNNIKLQREFRAKFNEISNTLRSIVTGSFSSSAGDKSKLSEYSPMTMLVGYSKPYVSPKQTVSRGFFPNFADNTNLWSGDSIKQKTNVGLQDLREVSQEFNNLYSTKSFMSMDGIFHPVSFYPTILGSTTPYKRYYKTGCQVCGGTKQFTLNTGGSQITLWCDYCSEEIAGKEICETGPVGAAPPYILSNEADGTIISNPNAVSELLKDTLLTKRINYVNLNPIIMPVGELRNKYAQDNDFTSHHIEAIGRSQVPMAGSLSISDNLNINQQGLEYKDYNSLDCDMDWNSKAFDVYIGRNPPSSLQMNNRFMALRGPLVIAGWGFDTEGYPVPNASGEPKLLDAGGYPKRIKDLTDETGGFRNYEGSILGKNQVWDEDEGRWSAPVKENKFYKGWGLRPDQWPVGPVDLRWDYNRKVWTCPVPYKIVDVQLEDNLIPPFPARGFLDKYDKDSPLPNNLRRMVFVKDSGGTFGAPRGAKILCYYDEASGFYEVINKQNIIAKGYIKGNGVASIIAAYASGYTSTGEAEPVEDITVEFDNFLNYSITSSNQPGIFMWIKDKWVLTSTNNCG